MPRTTTTPVPAFAHCVDWACAGNKQQPVDGVLEETAFTFVELGGDFPGVERSQTVVRFANAGQDDGPDDRPCPHCGGHRDITDQKRPKYESRYDPNGLLDLLRQGLVRGPGEPADQSAEIAALKAQLADVMALLETKANKPGPKPKES